MAAPAPNFIEQFDAAIRDLDAITEANVKASIDRRTQFTTRALSGLTGINTQIQSLVNRLTRFSQRYQQLIDNQGRYDTEINRITQKADALEGQIRDLTARNGSATEAIQQQLSQSETTRAQLEAENQRLTQQVAGLTQQVQDLEAQQSGAPSQAQIEHLTQQIQQLNDEIAANNNEKAQLQTQINDLQQQVAKNDAAHQAQINGHQTNIDDLERQIADLTATRDSLQSKIQVATPILQRIYRNINDLINTGPDDTQTAQFNDSLTQIQTALQQLNGLIPTQFNDGPTPPASGLASGLGSLFGSNSSSSVASDDSFGLPGGNVPNDTSGGKKMKKMKKIKKTKKIRKQKGGYTYNENKKGGFVIKTKKNKHRGITSKRFTKTNTRSSKRTSTRTSRNSINY
jgi:predicted  nucleic acid-binding Zn-ribbon protein